MKDLLEILFLKLCLHAAVSFATFVVYYLLNIIGFGENFYTGLWVCLFVTNCTALILSKLNRILERLPGDEEKN